MQTSLPYCNKPKQPSVHSYRAECLCIGTLCFSFGARARGWDRVGSAGAMLLNWASELGWGEGCAVWVRDLRRSM
jgi:hypothetical protein